MKRGVFKFTSIALLFICFLISPVSAGANQIIVDLPEFAITVESDTNGQAVFDGATLGGESGNPDLPVETVTLLLPPDANPETVKIKLSQPTYQEVTGVFDVKPVPPLMVTSSSRQYWPWESNIINGRNQTVYQNDQLFPIDNLGRISAGQKRKWVLAEITIYPYQYNPIKRTLRRLTGGQLVASFENLSSPKVNLSSEDVISEELKEEISKKAVNFSDIATQYNSLKTNQFAQQGYVIITTEAIRISSNQLDKFVKAKQEQGFKVEIITETTWGGGQGNVAAEQIRACLSSNYLSHNIKYVLLIGNPHPLSGDVPMKMCYPLPTENAPTDLYYAELTGNWDLNNNGRYGEFEGDCGPGGADRNFEVIVGRIPYYGSIYDLDTILAKTISYGNYDEADWRKRTLLPMEPSDKSTPGFHLGEAIKDLVGSQDTWDFHRIYEENYDLNPAPETIPCNVQNVIDVWTENYFGSVFWWTHGWSRGASDIIDTNAVTLLNNKRPAFTFQCSCSNSFPEDNSNLAYELLKNGAIGTVGGTRVTWYYPGQTIFDNTATNSGMTYQYAKNLIASLLPAGDALQKLKFHIAPGIKEFWMNYLDFVLYGDPSIGLQSYKKPIDLVVTDFTWTPDHVNTDSQIHFEATIKNHGTQAIPTGTQISVLFKEKDGQEIAGSDQVYLTQPLNPGATMTITANNTWRPYRGGDFSIYAVVSCNPHLEEWTDNNGSLTKNMVVNENALFIDTFEDGNANGWEVQYGNWSVITDNDPLVYYQSSTKEGRTWAGSPSWTDYAVEALVKVENFNGSNCAFVCARYKDGNNYYAASLYNNSGGKLQIRRKVKGSTKILTSKPFPLTTGIWYKIKLEVTGEQIKMYVNDELELTATDSSLTSGGIGLIAYKTQTKYDDIVVTE